MAASSTSACNHCRDRQNALQLYTLPAGFLSPLRDPGNVLQIIARPTRFPQHMHTSSRQPSIFHGAFSQWRTIRLPRDKFHSPDFPTDNPVSAAGIAQPVERRAIITKRVPVAQGDSGL